MFEHVKKRKVTVFAAPVVDVFGVTRRKQSEEPKLKIEEISGKLALVGKMVSNFAKLLANDATAKEGVEIQVSVRFPSEDQ
ncbi:hypothetical protein Y032_0929g3084 [Ancylostoma ceylanicum]|uniref:Uncharacterized protein n=1 Tax=Ancylostoma ceylanicum TaxID=53326 RepID=A0A016W957_9BILA|nr:hypothetical protein Y032_0929g3084 [Ancylostoma ceylanicum]